MQGKPHKGRKRDFQLNMIHCKLRRLSERHNAWGSFKILNNFYKTFKSLDYENILKIYASLMCRGGNFNGAYPTAQFNFLFSKFSIQY